MRRIVLTGAVALLAATAPLAHGASLSVLPKAGCDVVSDAAGDAVLTADLPVTPERNAHNWDITGMSYRLSGATFSVALRVPELGAGAARGTGDTWTTTFTARGKVVELQGSRNFATLPRLQDQYFGRQMGRDPQTVVTVGGAAVPVLLGMDYDQANGFVVFTVDRAALEKSVGGSLDALSNVSAASATRVVMTATDLDTVSGTSGQTILATANTCFS